MAEMRLDSFLAEEAIPAKSGTSMRLNDFLAQDNVRKTRISMIDYLDAAGQGISKAIGSAPGLIGELIKLSADHISGKGATIEDLYNPKSWTEKVLPFNIVLAADRLIRSKIYENTDIDEKVAAFGDRMANSNRLFINTGFPEQKTAGLKFVEDLGAGGISLASAIGMGMIAGPIAPGIAFGVAAKAAGYKEALDKDKTYNEARVISNYLGVFEGGLEFWGVHSIIRSGGGVIKRTIKGVATEFIQEFSQEGAEGLIKDFSDIQRQEFSQILQNALYAGSIGAVLGGSAAISVASSQKSQITKQLLRAGLSEEQAAIKTKEIMNKAGDAVLEETEKVIKHTYEEQQKQSQIVIKAASGQELTPEETKTLETVYNEFVAQGLIEPTPTPTEAEKVAPKPISKGKQGIVEALPEDLKPFAERARQLSKEEFLDKYNQGLKAQNLTTRDTAKNVDKLIKDSGFKSAEDFYDKIVSQPKGEAQTKAQQIVEASGKEVKKPKALSDKLKSIQAEFKQPLTIQRRSIKAVQEEVINIINDSDLEAKDKAKFIKTIKNTQTEAQLIKALPIIEERIARLEEAAEKRGLVRGILKQPKKPENIVDVKYQKQIDAILEKLGEKKQIRKKALNAMSVEELVELGNTLADLKETGKRVFASKKEQRKVASEIMRAALIKQAGGTKAGMFAKGSAQERKAKRSPLLKVADIITLRPLMMIRRLFGDVGEKLIYDTIDTADIQKGVQSWMRKKSVEVSMAKNKVTFFDLGKLIEIDGKSYQVNNILRMYLATKDRKSYEALKFGNNLSENEIAQFIETVKNDYPAYITFADEVQKIVANRTEEYAQTVEDYYNVEMERVDVYFPIRRICKGGISQEELNLDLETEMVNEQIIRKGAGFSYTSIDKKNTYTRKELDEKYQSEISLDFIGDALKIIESQEHLIAYAPLQKAFNKIIGDADIQDAVKYNHSQAAWKWLNDYLEVNVNPAKMFQGMNWVERYVNRGLKPVRLGLSKAYLGFNAVTSLKQLPSLTLALKYTTPQDMAISIERMMFAENRDKIYELDPSLKNRVVSRDFKDLLKTIESLPEGDIKRALLVASKAVDKKAFVMIMQMDKFAVLAVYDSVYRYQIKTKSEVEAKNIAHKAVIETQPQGGIKDLPAIYRTNNEFIRMMLMFTNQLNQIWNMVRADMPREVAKGEYARATTGIASIMISSTLIYIMSHGRLPEDADDFFDAIFGSMIASIPIVGNWSMSYLRGYDPSISPAESILSNLKYMKANIESEEYMKALEKASFVLAVWTQMPYAQIRRTIKGMIDLISGETDDFRRLLWSEYMLENQ